MDIIRYVNNGKTLRFNCVEGSDKFEHVPIIEKEIISLPNSCEDFLRQINESDRGMSGTKNQQCMTFQQSQQYMQNSQYVKTPVQNWQSQQDSIPTVPIEERRSVGLLLKDAYELNKYEEKSQIDAKRRIAEYSSKKAVDQSFKEDGRTNKAQNRIEVSSNALENNQENTNKNITIKLKNIEQEFICHYALVKVRVQGQTNRLYAMRSTEYNRHIYVTEKALLQEYSFFIEKKLPESEELSQATLDRSFNRLLHFVSKLEDSGLKVLESHQVMFLNGYFDVKTGKFYPVDAENHNQYFNTYSIEINFKQNALLPKVFDKMLHDMLGGNNKAMRLAYEQIGAMLTPIPILKKIIVFQGKSQGGKTRLSNIIQNLFTPDDIYPLDAISQMTADKLARSSKTPISLIYVKELGKNKLASEQIRSLKAFADGSNRLGGNPKILLNTNYAIYTGKETIEPALENRLSVLPFSKTMDNSDQDVSAFEDMYFETEKDDIILYSLQQFHFALQKGNKFSVEFPVNVCIEDDSEVNSELTPSDLRSINQAIASPSQLNTRPKFNQVLDKMFSLTKEVNPDMPAKFIMMKINEVLKDEVENTASLGKRLRSHFCDKLLFKRIRDDMCYNLDFRDNTQSVSQN